MCWHAAADPKSPQAAPIPASAHTGQFAPITSLALRKKNVGTSDRGDEAAILLRVIDCPEPELLENTGGQRRTDT